MSDTKIGINWETGELMEEQKEFIRRVINTFIKMEKVEKVEVTVSKEEMTAYIVIRKNFLMHKEIGRMYKNFARYGFNISLNNGKIEIIIGDH